MGGSRCGAIRIYNVFYLWKFTMAFTSEAKSWLSLVLVLAHWFLILALVLVLVV